MAARRLVNLLQRSRPTAGCGARGAASIAALVRIGDDPFRTPGKKDKPFQSSGIGAGGSKKARSVVALSRVPR
jgi:hypothetical protein